LEVLDFGFWGIENNNYGIKEYMGLERGWPFGVEGVSMDVEKTISFVTSCRGEPSSGGWISLAVQRFQSLKSLKSIIPIKI